MDQVKVILKHMKKHHFWLLSVVAVIACLVGWSMASSSMSASFISGKQIIEGKFSALQQIRGVEKPPNSVWKTELEKMTEAQTAKVAAAWETAYSEQRELLKWPESLGKDFVELLNDKPLDAIPSRFGSRYNEKASEEFNALLKLVDAEPAPPDVSGQGTSTTTPTPAAAIPGKEYTVLWDHSDQRAAARLFTWEDPPKDPEMRRAQEDLWVYRALLQIIADLNKDQFVPRVKRIYAMNVGKPAALSMFDGLHGGHLSNLQAASSDGAAAPPAPGAPAEEIKPADERYVDIEGKKVTGEIAAKSPFKGLPIFLKLQIDQREITRFLAACANSSLPIDITQLRINPGGKVSGRSARTMPAVGAPPTTAPDPFEVPIEVCGILYIFNPPNMANVTDNLVVKSRRGKAASSP